MEIQNMKSELLVTRLLDLVRRERQVEVEFLLHLGEFAARQRFIEEGHGSLWDYCEKKLGWPYHFLASK